MRRKRNRTNAREKTNEGKSIKRERARERGGEKREREVENRAAVANGI